MAMNSAIDRFNTRLINEATGYNDMEQKRADIFNRWSKTPLLRKLNEKEAKDVSVLLENQAITLKKMMNENTNTSDIATFNKVAFPLVRRVYGGLIAKDIVSIQPMSSPQTLVFYIDYKYVDNNQNNLGYPYGHLESNAFDDAAFNKDYSAYLSTGTVMLSGGMTTDSTNGQGYFSISAAAAMTLSAGLPSDLEWGSLVKVYKTGLTGWATTNWNYGGVGTTYPYGSPTEYMGSYHTDRLYIYKAISADNTEFSGSTLAAVLTGAAFTAEYSQRASKSSSEGSAAVRIPRISFEMKSKPVEAKTRKLMVQ